jgi:phosphodiesterase/alkaline phosphatase D-like protein
VKLNQRHTATIVLLASSLACAVSVGANGDEPVELSKIVQGKWVRHQATANGPVKIVKEHKAQNTIVTAYDDKDNVIYAHESEFKIEQSGKVRIFTFFNRTITAGPNAGQKIKEPVSFVYRVAENRFIEVHGVLDGDTNAPNMIIWDRLKDETKGKDAA